MWWAGGVAAGAGSRVRWRWAWAVLAWAWALAAAAQGDAVARGRALYEGGLPGTAGSAAPACVGCHRPSGLGSFEGGVAAPPVAGRLLFQPHDPATAHFFSDARRYRVRPAYDLVALQTLLTTGVAPDGYPIRAPMPRYAADDRQVADLAAYLATLSPGRGAGVDDEVVHLATVVTPAAQPQRVQAMLAVIERFTALHNAQSRHETRRRAVAQQTHEMAMAKKYRRWAVHVWRLEGDDAAAWGGQLKRLQAQRPVFALLAGMGSPWEPVHQFCEQQRLPCLLPQVTGGIPGQGNGGGFYSVYFHRGWAADVEMALQAVARAGLDEVEVWGDPPQDLAASAQAAGVRLWQPAAGRARPRAVLSVLAPAEQLARLAQPEGAGAAARWVAWAPGDQLVAADEWDRAAAATRQGVFVSPFAPAGAPLWHRAKAWLKQQGLDQLPLEVASATLQAITVLGDVLTHIDFEFTPEYAVELLEHGLENMVPFGPYPKLAIAPGQRVAAKGSLVAEVRNGHLDPWRWTLAAPR